jgi:hypothetical protein
LRLPIWQGRILWLEPRLLVKDSAAPGQDPIVMLPVEGASSLVASSTSITGLFFFDGAEAGAYDAVVTNPDGQSATLSGGFTVTE